MHCLRAHVQICSVVVLTFSFVCFIVVLTFSFVCFISACTYGISMSHMARCMTECIAMTEAVLSPEVKLCVCLISGPASLVCLSIIMLT